MYSCSCNLPSNEKTSLSRWFTVMEDEARRSGKNDSHNKRISWVEKVLHCFRLLFSESIRARGLSAMNSESHGASTSAVELEGIIRRHLRSFIVWNCLVIIPEEGRIKVRRQGNRLAADWQSSNKAFTSRTIKKKEKKTTKDNESRHNKRTEKKEGSGHTKSEDQRLRIEPWMLLCSEHCYKQLFDKKETVQQMIHREKRQNSPNRRKRIPLICWRKRPIFWRLERCKLPGRRRCLTHPIQGLWRQFDQIW